MLNTNFVPYEMKTTILRIWSYNGRDIKGTIQNSYYERPLGFDNLTTMLLLLDELYDSINYPQKAMEDRRFRTEDAPKLSETCELEEEKPVKPMASFKVNVLFRQNASWQGNLIWIDENAESQFRSALELVKLLDEALSR